MAHTHLCGLLISDVYRLSITAGDTLEQHYNSVKLPKRCRERAK